MNTKIIGHAHMIPLKGLAYLTVHCMRMYLPVHQHEIMSNGSGESFGLGKCFKCFTCC